jgi:hypothetical protein
MLPDAIFCNIVCHWLRLADVTRLDTSFCNKIERNNFLTIISNECFLHEEFFFERTTHTSQMMWVVLRGQKLDYVLLSKDFLIQQNYSLLRLERVEKLKFSSLIEDHRENVNLIERCTRLKSLCFSCGEEDAYQNVVPLIKSSIMEQLTSFEISTMPIFIVAVEHLLSHCHNLKELKLLPYCNDDYEPYFNESTEDQMIQLVLQNKHQLTNIALSNVCTDRFLSIITSQFQHLIHLDLERCTPGQITIKNLIKFCKTHPNWKSINVNFVPVDETFDEMGDEIQLEFGNNFTTRQHFTFRMGIIENHELIEECLQLIENINYLNISRQYNMTNKIIPFIIKKLIDLTSLTIISCENTCTFNDLKELFLTCDKLVTVHIISSTNFDYELNDEIMKFVQKHCKAIVIDDWW